MRVVVALAFIFATAHARTERLATANYAVAETATSTASTAGATRHVIKITLDSSHGGWGHQHYAGTIERLGAGFILDGAAIDDAKVSALLEAVQSRASRLPEEQLASLIEFLTDHCDSAMSGGFGSQMRNESYSAAAMPVCQSGAKDFVRKYLSPQNLSFHTDDYPEEALVITFDDGHTVSALSKSQNAFMLPWRIVGPSFQGLIYDTTLPRSIVALFGKNDVNAKRMSSDALAKAYGEDLHGPASISWTS